MSVEAFIYVMALTQQEEHGLTKNVQMLLLIWNTLKRAREEECIEKFLRKECLIK